MYVGFVFVCARRGGMENGSAFQQQSDQSALPRVVSGWGDGGRPGTAAMLECGTEGPVFGVFATMVGLRWRGEKAS